MERKYFCFAYFHEGKKKSKRHGKKECITTEGFEN